MLTYQKREEAIKFTSKKKLIFLPILFSILLVVLIPILTSVVVAGGIWLINQTTGSNMKLFEMNAISISSTIEMILNVIISTFVLIKIAKIKIKDLGFDFINVFSKIIKGSIGGFVAISAVALLVNWLGVVETTFVFKTEYIGTLLLGMVFFAFQGTYEELMFRGYLMPHLSKGMGIIGSIIVSSMLFAVLHSFNPGMTTMPVINLFLAGVVFGVVYYYSGSLWVVGLAHGVWNYSQGFIYGSLVSGLKVEETVCKSIPITDNILLSGGNFGFEGSIATTIIGVIITVLFVVLIMKKKKN